MWRDEDDYDLEEYDDERFLEEQDRHDEAFEEDEEHHDALYEQTTNIEENTRELAEEGVGYGGYEYEDEGPAGLQSEEDVIAEERAIEREIDGLDDELRDWLEHQDDRDDDTEDPFGGIA